MQQTNDYWDKRALRRLTDSEKISEQHIRRIKKIYERAFKNIDRDIKNIYQNYYKVANTGERKIDIQKLKELLTRSETKKTWDQLKRQGLDKYVMDNYKARISRLEQLQAQIYAKAKTIYPKEELEQTMAYKGVINDSYYKAIYDTQIGTGYDFSFSMLDKNLVNAVLNEKWSDKNYSQRIWTNTDILADSISEIIGGSLLSGQGIEKTEKQIRERFNVGKHYAERLVRTETNYFHNKADAMAYEEMGVKYYIFVAVLDNRTSEICQSMDGTKHKYSEMQVGENYPPMHVNCRSKTRGFISSEVEKMLKRRARDPITGENEIIDNISYKEWYDNAISKYGKEPVEKARKITQNSWLDHKQYEKYKKIFPEIDSIDKFISIKYNQDEWNKYKKQYRILNQYKIDSGNMDNEQILKLDREAISFKRNKLRSGQKYSGNIGIMEIDGNTYYAHSKIDYDNQKEYANLPKGTQEQLVLMPQKSNFEALSVNGYIRNSDSEYKLFNYVASIKKPSDAFTINMLSERCMCESCQKVMRDFKEIYYNATINVVSNKKMKNPWKYRGKKNDKKN